MIRSQKVEGSIRAEQSPHSARGCRRVTGTSEAGTFPRYSSSLSGSLTHSLRVCQENVAVPESFQRSLLDSQIQTV